MNLSSLCCATHPIGKNGNDSSKVWHCSVICVHSPHEKHPSVESDNSSGWVMSSSVTVSTVSTGSQLSNGVSKSFVEGRSCDHVFHGLSEEIAGVGPSSVTWQVIRTGRLSALIRGWISVSPIFDNCQPSRSLGYLVLNCPNVCGAHNPPVHLWNGLSHHLQLNLRASVSSSIAKIDA